LKVVSTKALEEAAQQARIDKLRVAIRSSCAHLVKDLSVSAGRYTLLTNDELEQICPQNKKLFPSTSYN
jgi:hypothetical protein